MRFFLIADEQGNPLYYDHPEGRMLSLILVNTHLLVLTNFGQRFKSMSCGNVKFVYTMYSKLSFIVVSDQGESEMYLRTQLQQIFDHLVMVFGKEAVMEGKYTFFSRHKKKIQFIIDTLCDLGDKHQSMLIRATERLEVDESTRDSCFKGLKKAVKNESLATHGMIFVGTKRLASYSKSGAGSDLDPTDVLLLINHFHATFHPYVREVFETAVPVADYSALPGAVSLESSGLLPPESDGFVSASEELDEIEKEADLTVVSTQLLSPTLATILYEKLKALEEGEENRGDLMFSCEESFRNRSPLAALNELKIDEATTTPDSDAELSGLVIRFFEALDQDKFSIGNSGDYILLLHEMLSVISYLPGILGNDFNENTALALSEFQANNNIEKTGIPNFFTMKLLTEQVIKYYTKRRRIDMKKRRKEKLKEKKSASKGTLPPLMEEDEGVGEVGVVEGVVGGQGGGDNAERHSGAESSTDDDVEDDVFMKKGEEEEEEPTEDHKEHEEEQEIGSPSTVKKRRPTHERRKTKALHAPRFGSEELIYSSSDGDAFKVPASPQDDGELKRRTESESLNQTFPLMDSSSSDEEEKEGKSNTRQQNQQQQQQPKKKSPLPFQRKPSPPVIVPINNSDPKAMESAVDSEREDAADVSSRTKGKYVSSSADSSRSSSPEPNYLSTPLTHSSSSSSPPLHNLSPLHSAAQVQAHQGTPALVISHDFSDPQSNATTSSPYFAQSPRMTHPYLNNLNNSSSSSDTSASPNPNVWQGYTPSRGQKRGNVLAEGMKLDLGNSQDGDEEDEETEGNEGEKEEEDGGGGKEKRASTVVKRTLTVTETGEGKESGLLTETTTETTETTAKTHLHSLPPHHQHPAENEEEQEEDFTELRREHKLLHEDFVDSFDPSKFTAYQMLYLRLPKYTPRWVYFAELEPSTTLVLVCSNHPANGAKGDPGERQRLDNIRDKMRKLIKPYAAYLSTKEQTHLPILSFLHQFPGLVHFIFVDRTHNRVIAPTIASLHGMDYFAWIGNTLDKPAKTLEEKEALLESLKLQHLLKGKIWDMCYKAQQKLSEGYFFMLMKSGAFQYSYRLWVEDTEHDEAAFTLENKVTPMQTPQNYRFYKDLVKKSFPSRSGLRCYELYTLYLGVLSVKSVINHDKNLVSILKK